ncbi:PAS domain-containing hybrid sensor histidine kinase/response regulator [Arsukibacterium sp.]|uniref:PAS domain-containing hybrid sensor histidine kinase/response regulator n=1 Tax=Arsukibacterium sp. TaxID=1977258 RepID=UPI00299F0BC8|nr:PAS domain-containing hybrid sensor histidine kinase/response regulator [Arsukibacterium sp.]MDX1537591.1 PAS domain-containing hybrid sensor histidine kinase/response regulator [Arsukibacterium sp.]
MTSPEQMIENGSGIGLATIAAISLVYLLILFSVGRFGRRITARHPLAPWIFSFALSIYCTSWAFYGVTAQAAVNGWWIPPTYIGSFILFWFGFKLIARIAIACRRYRITSVADFIATRFGHSRSLAVLITLILIMAVIPYIALQLHAVSTSINTLVQAEVGRHWYTDTGFYVSLWMAVFALLFVSKSARAHQPNPGLMTAIAFESLIKLLALLAIGCFVVFGMFDGFASIFDSAAADPAISKLRQQALPTHAYWLHALLGFFATLCLPRQFHVSFVENQKLSHLRSARWIFPLYLLLMSIFTLPLALAGVMLLGNDVNIDVVVLQLPLAANRTDIALLAYLGGFSAATSMVVVATVVLGIMITNELLAPVVYRSSQLQAAQQNRVKVATLRRSAMLTVMALGFIYYRFIGTETGLAQLGLMAFALVAQLAPALILGLLSRKVNRQGAMAGVLSGAIVWAYILLFPEISRAGLMGSAWLSQGPFGLVWLAPQQLFGWQADPLSLGVLLSLTVNCLMVLLISRFSNTRVSEWLESGRFLRAQLSTDHNRRSVALSVQDCYLLVKRFAGEKEARRLLLRNLKDPNPAQNQLAPLNLVQAAERSLAAVVGGASMRLIMDAAGRHAQLPMETVERFVDEASQVFQFNQALLLSTIDNISQGISVVDADLRLIAWNQRYIDMFSYPPGMVEVGKPVADVIRFNLQRGLIDSENIDAEVSKRLSFLRQGSSYKFQRQQQDGRVLEMQGSPLPGGGFVTTYTDVSSFIEVQTQLEQSNTLLEQRVTERTHELQQLNQQLQHTQKQLETNTAAKTRFFAAASHDLMQPFNAAALFAGLLRQQSTTPELRQLSVNLTNSLNSAEELLTAILDLTKLDSGVIKAYPQTVTVSQLLDDIGRDAAVLAAEKGLQFRVHSSKLSVSTDRKLVKRVIQNLLANAVRYTSQGKVILGVKRAGQQLQIRVMDTGVGIARADQQRIFEEFQQGSQPDQKGLGLGLAIAHRISAILGHSLTVQSTPGKGSCFCLSLPLAAAAATPAVSAAASSEISASFAGKKILLLDNEAHLLSAVSALLSSWQCQVTAVSQPGEALAAISQGLKPDLCLFDYHLDNAATGVAVAEQLVSHFAINVPVIIHSADHDQNIREQALNSGFYFLLKPLKPAALKRLFQRLLRD